MNRLLAYCAAPDPAQGGFGPETVEAWPAAGGGLLVGIVEPAFAGAVPVRRAVKTIFIRIDDSDVIRVTLPYATLENEARACIRVSVATELFVRESRIEIHTPEYVSAKPTGVIVDIDPNAERSLRICAAVARTLLVSAAAERLGVAADLYQVSDGAVFSSEVCVPYRDVCADAALCDAPSSVRLHCGRSITLSGATTEPCVPADVSVLPMQADRDQIARLGSGNRKGED